MRICLLHRYPPGQINETNAAFPYLQTKGIDILTFKKFDRLSKWKKFFKSLTWIFYAPFLAAGRGYKVIYCDDSYPFYPALVKLFSPKSKVIIRLGDLHLAYYYSGWVYKVLHFLEKICWLSADLIIPISEPMADFIRAEIKGLVPIKTVMDPIDPRDFSVNGAKSEGTVMFHGVLTRNKGVNILLEAARRLPEVEFVIIGNGPDKKRLQNAATGNVVFKGWVPFKSIHRHIATCAVGVALRSDNPGNEYVVTSPFLQYGLMGKPCLVTRRKVFGDYEWQFSGVDEMVTKIHQLMAKPEEGEKLREYVLKNHDAEKIAEEIWNLLS